tara:strand:+ start:711 stop:1361 length:651 start_codon:yes stop_codon:yes gene_type:complete
MPNWCNNELTVTGDEDKLEEFKEYCYGEWYHDKCGRQEIWVVNKDATEAPWGEYKNNPDYCGEEEFKDSCDKQRQHFSFRSILPMPKEIEHTGSPVRIYDTQEELDEYIKEYYGSEKAQSFYGKQVVAQAMTREYASYLERTYGADNWYDWSCEHWGTKWDASEPYLEDDGWMLRYDFDTAWSPPEPICEFLRDKFPDVHISWFFREEGMEMAGYL